MKKDIKPFCSQCTKEKYFIKLLQNGEMEIGLYSYCKDCDLRGRKGFVSGNTHREILTRLEVEEIEKRNRVWVKRLIKDGELLHPSEYICSLGGCRDKAEHYHHIKYDSRSLIDPISIITPLCRQCNKYLHSRLKQGVDISDMITDRIVLEYKLPPVFL